jgi:hypothetical protein
MSRQRVHLTLVVTWYFGETLMALFNRPQVRFAARVLTATVDVDITRIAIENNTPPPEGMPCLNMPIVARSNRNLTLRHCIRAQIQSIL